MSNLGNINIKVNIIITAPEAEMKAASNAIANLRIMAERMPAGKVRSEYCQYIHDIMDMMAVIESREE